MYISPMAIKRHKLYEEIADHVHSFVIGNGGNDTDAEKLSDGIVNLIADLFGGQNFTFPKDIGYDLKARDLKIYNEFLGSANTVALGKKYGLTERGIYKVIARVKNKLRTEKQSVKE